MNFTPVNGKLYDTTQAILMLVTDVWDSLCWRQVWNVGDRFWTSIKSVYILVEIMWDVFWIQGNKYMLSIDQILGANSASNDWIPITYVKLVLRITFKNFLQALSEDTVHTSCGSHKLRWENRYEEFSRIVPTCDISNYFTDYYFWVEFV